LPTGETHIVEEQAQVIQQGAFLEVLGVFAKLGITSFGGPIAHLGYLCSEAYNQIAIS